MSWKKRMKSDLDHINSATTFQLAHNVLLISFLWCASAKMRAMNILLCIAITTGILSGYGDGWRCLSGLLSWAGFLGCTAYFACPQGGVKGLFISGCTLMSGVIWALVIMKGSALAPHLEILGYVMTGVVAFLMCIQAKHLLLSFVPGTFMGACATFAGQGDWKLVVPHWRWGCCLAMP
jgi:hypothetical protein